MGATFTPRPIQYLVEEDGQRVGVVLRWEDYQKLCATHPVDPDLLVSLSDAELQALADSVLVPRQQERLSDLLRRNRDEGLSADEERELDRLLERVDQMNVLKARAIYTLQQRSTSEAQWVQPFPHSYVSRHARGLRVAASIVRHRKSSLARFVDETGTPRDTLPSIVLTGAIHMAVWNVRYYIDPETDLPHIHNHSVTEEEVEEVLSKPGEDRQGYEGARVAIGQTEAGRYLRVIYVPDPEPGSVFVITAYELRRKALKAYRRRRRRRQR